MALDNLLTQREVQVPNSLGLHARPAALFVKLATSFDSDIEVGTDAMMVNAKSIMGVMMLAAERDSVITVRANGKDEAAAVDALAALVARGFDE